MFWKNQFQTFYFFTHMETIIKIKKRENPFAQIDKEAINDDSMSWAAKGMLTYLISKPADWKVQVNHLIKKATDGRDAVYSILRELREVGYMLMETKNDAKGRLMTVYTVSEKPEFKGKYKKPEKKKKLPPLTDSPLTKNPY